MKMGLEEIHTNALRAELLEAIKRYANSPRWEFRDVMYLNFAGLIRSLPTAERRELEHYLRTGDEGSVPASIAMLSARLERATWQEVDRWYREAMNLPRAPRHRARPWKV
jgi:hypothetical protein